MKRTLILVVSIVAAVAAATAGYTDGYYNAMDGKKRESLKAAAKQCVKSHRTLVYTDLPVYWEFSDVYPQLVNGCKRWWEMYSNQEYLILKGQNARSSFSANKMQREHAIPKSWWKYNGDVEYTPAYSDMWNLYPSDGPANQAKLNYPLGMTRSANFDNGVTKVGPAQTGYGGGSGNVFEPADEYKGDFARAAFYMATVYDDLPWCVNYMYMADSPWPTLKDWAVSMLLQWARMDPVSQKEITRNDEVEKSQGNRNPFVDFPELAEYIWGTRTSETFLLSEQGGGNVTPPITGDPELTDPVNGVSLDFPQVVVGQSVNAPLHISGSNMTSPLSIRVVGTDKGMFVPEVTSIPAANINNDSGYLLNILYTPTTVGRHEARILLYDGGLPDGYNVAVNLIGEAYPVPTLSTITAIEPLDLTDTSYTAQWLPAPAAESVDYYILRRIKYTEEGAEAEVYTTDFPYYGITDRDPELTESYTVTSYRLGYESNPSNSIVIPAKDSGIAATVAAQPLTLGRVPGGFVLLIDGRHTGLRVFDMTGRTILFRETVEGGEEILLPAGIYLVKTDQSSSYKKIIID